MVSSYRPVLMAVTVSFVLTLPLPAVAEDRTAEMEALRKTIKRELDYRILSAGYTENALSTEGGIVITPQAGYYAVKLPRMKVTYPDGSYLDMGTIAMNASPGASVAEWKMSVALPSPMIMYNASAQPEFEVTIGQQRLAFVWRDDQVIAPKLEAAYSDIVLKSIDQPGVGMRVGAMTSTFNLTQDSEGLWSGPYNVKVSNIEDMITRAISADATPVPAGLDPFDLKIASMNMEGSYDKADFSQNVRLRDLVISMQDAQKDPAKRAQLDQKVRTMFASMPITVDSMTGRNTVTGIDLTIRDAAGERGVSLQSLQADFNVHKLRSQSSDLRSGVVFSGLQLKGAPSDIVALVPQSGKIGVAVTKLPAVGIFDTLRKTLGTDAQSAQAVPGAGILGLLQKAGTSLVIEDSYLTAQKLNATMDGKLVLDPATGNPAGLVNVLFSGLEDLIPAMLKAQQAGTATPGMQNALKMLTTLQLLGQQETDKAGKPARAFRFTFNPDGNITMNNVPLGALGTMMGKPQTGSAMPALPTAPSTTP